LQQKQIIRVKFEKVFLDSSIFKVHPDGTGALKNGPQAIGKSRGGLTTKMHLVAANARCALSFVLSPGQAGDAPSGCHLIVPTMGMKHASWLWSLVSHLFPRQTPTAFRSGNTAGRCVAAAKKSSGSSGASSLTSTSSMSCSPPLSNSLSLSKA
jgi:hypothetical protein